MTSPLAQEIGLGNNILHRVLQKGFPVPEMAMVVNPPMQGLPGGISEALAKCKLELADDPSVRCAVQLAPHDFPSTLAPTAFYEEHLVDVPILSSRAIRLRPAHVPSDSQLRHDLNSLKLDFGLMPQERLTATVSGNTYTVLSAPAPAPSAPVGKWVVKIERDRFGSSNHEEAALAASLARRLLGAGTKPKNLAIFSPFANQLHKIAELLGQEGNGVAFRTPYNICGEQWGTAIISCAADSLVNTDSDLASPRLFYTLFRSCIKDLHLVAHRNLISHHPFLRHL